MILTLDRKAAQSTEHHCYNKAPSITVFCRNEFPNHCHLKVNHEEWFPDTLHRPSFDLCVCACIYVWVCKHECRYGGQRRQEPWRWSDSGELPSTGARNWVLWKPVSTLNPLSHLSNRTNLFLKSKNLSNNKNIKIQISDEPQI